MIHQAYMNIYRYKDKIGYEVSRSKVEAQKTRLSDDEVTVRVRWWMTSEQEKYVKG